MLPLFGLFGLKNSVLSSTQPEELKELDSTSSQVKRISRIEKDTHRDLRDMPHSPLEISKASRFVNKGLSVLESGFETYQSLSYLLWGVKEEEKELIVPPESKKCLNSFTPLLELGVPDTLISQIQTSLNKHFESKPQTAGTKPAFVETLHIADLDDFVAISSIPSIATTESFDQLQIIFATLVNGQAFSVTNNNMAKKNYIEEYRTNETALKKQIVRDLEGKFELCVDNKQVETFEDLEKLLDDPAISKEVKNLTMAQCTQGTFLEAFQGLTNSFFHPNLANVSPDNNRSKINIITQGDNITICAYNTFLYQPFDPTKLTLGTFKTETHLVIPKNEIGLPTGSWTWQVIMLPRDLG